MSEKLIIDNRTDLPMADVMPYVSAVLRQGRISNDGKQYCYLTTFGGSIVVASDLNEKSDRLIVYQEKRNG